MKFTPAYATLMTTSVGAGSDTGRSGVRSMTSTPPFFANVIALIVVGSDIVCRREERARKGRYERGLALKVGVMSKSRIFLGRHRCMAVEMSDNNQRRKRVHVGKWSRVQTLVQIGPASLSFLHLALSTVWTTPGAPLRKRTSDSRQLSWKLRIIAAQLLLPDSEQECEIWMTGPRRPAAGKVLSLVSACLTVVTSCIKVAAL
jgi:hypothetical protein